MLKVPNLFSHRCLSGDCCADFRESLAAPHPPDVHHIAVYSKNDGIVSWRACLDPDADELIEITSSHCGMAVNATCYRIVGHALASFGAADAHGDAGIIADTRFDEAA